MTISRIAPELIARSFGLVGTVENTRVVLPLNVVFPPLPVWLKSP